MDNQEIHCWLLSGSQWYPIYCSLNCGQLPKKLLTDLEKILKDIADWSGDSYKIHFWSVDNYKRHCCLICGQLPKALLTDLWIANKNVSVWSVDYATKYIIDYSVHATKNIADWSMAIHQRHCWLICGYPSKTMLTDLWIAIKIIADLSGDSNTAQWTAESYQRHCWLIWGLL